MRKLKLTATAVLFAVALLSAYKLVGYNKSSADAESSFNELSEQVFIHRNSKTGETITPVKKLQEKNSDTVGWIYISGTVVDYPVMHTPDDPEYYLHRNFSGEYSMSGTPFMDSRCSDNSDNIIIYGHNMKSGTMFAGLADYLDDTYLSEHSDITYMTAVEIRCYKAIAAFQADMDSNDTDFNWFDIVDFENNAVFEDFVNGVENNCGKEIEAQYGNGFLTLVTCSSDGKDKYVVIAQQVN